MESPLQVFVDPLTAPVAIPLGAAVLCGLVPERLRELRAPLTIVAAALTGARVVGLLTAGSVPVQDGWSADPLSGLCALGATVATLLVALFAVGWGRGGEVPGHRLLHVSMCASLAAANAVFLAGSLLVLLVAWGSSAVLLYLMIASAGPDAAGAARKALMIVGGADAALLLGVVLLWSEAGAGPGLAPGALGAAEGPTFLLCATAAFAKLGAVPLHGWVAPSAARAHGPTAALMLGALDKLLGVYLLARLVGERPSALLLAIGGASIAVGMLLAVVDLDARRLLGYSSVAQVGYMLLGLGSGTALGRAGALFHLVNNTLYKPALFATTSAVERRTGSRDLRDLGGMAGEMPVTFVAALVCGLSLAGVPPLNGFFSKWMVYQGLFEARSQGGVGWALGLIVAMVGSALTLAAIARLLHATYLRKRTRPAAGAGRESLWMAAPPVLVAISCVALGIFAERIALRALILPATAGEVVYAGTWWSGTGALLLGVAVGAGCLLYLGARGKVRRAPTYVGGEDLSRVRTSGVPASPDRDVEVSGADFFDTLPKLAGLRLFYRADAGRWLDVDDLLGRLVGWPVELSRRAHGGLLGSYASWIVLGLGLSLLVMGAVR